MKENKEEKDQKILKKVRKRQLQGSNKNMEHNDGEDKDMKIRKLGRREEDMEQDQEKKVDIILLRKREKNRRIKL